MAQRREHTIRQGTSERYWYTLAAYLAISALALIYSAVMYLETGDNLVATFGAAIGIMILSFGGIIVYPALFKDSAYVRGVNYWQPKWWKYIGFGLGTPLIVYLGLTLANLPSAAAVAFFLHALTAPTVAIHYLYKRHVHVGVP